MTVAQLATLLRHEKIRDVEFWHIDRHCQSKITSIQSDTIHVQGTDLDETFKEALAKAERAWMH